jgi:hypothetical protein
MTEAEWETCWEPETLIRTLRDSFGAVRKKAGRRKLRLYACACCRRIWELILDDACRQAVECSEHFAEGMIAKEELEAACCAATEAAERRWQTAWEQCRCDQANPVTVLWRAARAAELAADKEPGLAAGVVGPIIALDVSPRGVEAEKRAQIALIHEIFPNPYRPLSISPTWNRGSVMTLARTIAQEGVFNHLPILADALEDAGCTDVAVLDHCRNPGPHVRGCWVVDALLAKG